MKKEKNITLNNNLKNCGKQEKYREVKVDGAGFEKRYVNPMTKTFQFEYALVKAVSGLFSSVRYRSMCIDRLNLYFKELPRSREQAGEKAEGYSDSIRRRKTQEGLLSEMATLVERDVSGKVTFPMMHICQADVFVSTEADGTHSFIFTDGIYGFRVHLNMQVTGKSKKIEVKDLGPVHPVDGNNRKKAARKSAA
ncbi:MAG: hypothetical protein K5770_02725 [Lachnospiraceae bacterium]|nr:hypothetical protein [Lachnospiraceae bacterium]